MIRFLILLFLPLLSYADDILGYWNAVDQDTYQPRCCVAIYEYEGKRYGRIIGTFDEEGHLKETIYDPKERAPGVIGNPYYCGLDLIWNLVPDGYEYRGKIIDPEKGGVYNAELWREGKNLMVRGRLLIFSKTQTWLPAAKTQFPKGFKLPKLNSMVPQIPESR
jgi:hypothetical protein